MWPLAVIAAGLVIGLVLSVLGIGFGRGQERTLLTVDACPDPTAGPDGDLPLPEAPVMARATARWQPDDAGATPRT